MRIGGSDKQHEPPPVGWAEKILFGVGFHRDEEKKCTRAKNPICAKVLVTDFSRGSPPSLFLLCNWISRGGEWNSENLKQHLNSM